MRPRQRTAHSVGKPERPPTSPSTERSHNAKRARTAAQDGLYSKAIQALSSEGLASISPEVLQEMHPQATPAALPLGLVPPPTSVSEAHVLKGVKSFPNGFAAGLSGLTTGELYPLTRAFLLAVLPRLNKCLADTHTHTHTHLAT